MSSPGHRINESPGQQAQRPADPLMALTIGAAAAAATLLGARLLDPLAVPALVTAGVCLALALWLRVDLFSPPVLFTGLWALCAAIGSQIVSVEQRPWNAAVWISVIMAPVAFWAGDAAGRLLRPTRSGDEQRATSDRPPPLPPWPPRAAAVGGTLWLIAAAGLSLWEFRTVVGSVPLLSADWETARMVGSEGYVGRLVHALAYSGILLAMVLQAVLLTQPRLIAWATLPLWALWVGALGLAALWGSRHTLFLPLAAGVVSAHCLRWRLGPLRLALIALAGAAFVAAVGYVRMAAEWRQEADLAWSQVLGDIGYRGWPPVLAQIHQTVAINFEIFRRLTETFPAQVPHTLGVFTFHGLWSLLPGMQPTLPQVQNALWNTGFYGTLTSTYMGPLYADFGVGGIVLWTAAFALVMRWMHDSLRLRPTAVKALWFSFMMTHLILFPYDNPVVKLSFLINLLVLWLGVTALGGRRGGTWPLSSPSRPPIIAA